MRNIAFLTLLLLYFFDAGAQSLPFQRQGLWGLVRTNGEILLPPRFEHISDFDSLGRALFRAGGLVGVLGQDGRELLPAIYDKIVPANAQAIIAWKDGKAGLIALTGGQMLIPHQYELMRLFSPTLLLTETAGLKGLATTDGRNQLTPAFDEVDPANWHALAHRVRKNKLYGLVGLDATLLAEPVYTEIIAGINRFICKSPKSILLIDLHPDGTLARKADFPNELAMDLALKKETDQRAAELLKSTPEAQKPRWVQVGGLVQLVNGAGINLTGKSFYEATEDPQTGLVLAKEYNEKTKKTTCYVLKNQEVKPLFGTIAEDLALTDFQESNYARVSIDTLWDGLVSRSGEVIRELTGADGKKWPVQNCGPFYQGRAWVKSGNLFGFVDQDAKLITPFQYQVASDFSEGMAVVRQNDRFGLIDLQGKVAIPIEHDGIATPSAGLIRIKKGKGNAGRWGAVSLKGEQVIPFEYAAIGDFKEGVAKILRNGKWGLIDPKGKILVPPTIEADMLSESENGLIQIWKGRIIDEIAKKTGEIAYQFTGYMRKDGKILLPPIYSKIEGFEACWLAQNGLAKIFIGQMTGYVNYLGEVVVPAEYTKIDDFPQVWLNSRGLALAQKGKLVGYLDHNGKEVLPATYMFVKNTFPEIYAKKSGKVIAATNNQFGIIDHEGKPVLPFIYDYISDFSDQVAIVRKNGKWGAVSIKGEPILEVKYDGVRFVEGSEKQLLEVFQNQPFFLEIDPDGQVLRRVENAESATAAGNSVQIVEKGGLKGLANAAGTPVTKLKYKKIGPFQYGLAFFQADDKDPKQQLYGYLDSSGKEVIPAQFTLAANFGPDGLAPAMLKGKWGYIGRSGQWEIQPTFRSASAFGQGYAIVNGKEIINNKGVKVADVPLAGEAVAPFLQNRAIWQTPDGALHIRPDGLPAYSTLYDEVTPFYGKVAFAKRGEQWELVRQMNDYDKTSVFFSKAEKDAYLKAYGRGRVVKTPYGDLIRDLTWNLADPGKWKMIYPDGQFASENVFTQLIPLAEGRVLVKLERQFGIADATGRFLVEPACENIRSVSVGNRQNCLRLEQGGKITYLSAKGQWIFRE